MTHIVVGDGYMIADKRTTFYSGAHVSVGKKAGSKRAMFYRDDTVKIVIPTEKMICEISRDNPIPVVALSMSGSYKDNYMHPVELVKQFYCLNKFTDLLNNGAFNIDNFSIMAFLADGSVVVISESISGKKRTHWNTIRHHGDKMYKSIGSGAFTNKLLEPLYKQGKITILDAFIYGSYMDPHSSVNYSVFGLKENMLYTSINPSEEEQKTVVEKVHSLLAFSSAKRHYLPPQTVSE